MNAPRISNFQQKQQADHFKAMRTTIYIVAQKEVTRRLWISAHLEDSQQISELSV
jgi:hypothetical protein